MLQEPEGKTESQESSDKSIRLALDLRRQLCSRVRQPRTIVEDSFGRRTDSGSVCLGSSRSRRRRRRRSRSLVVVVVVVVAAVEAAGAAAGGGAAASLAVAVVVAAAAALGVVVDIVMRCMTLNHQH